MAGRSVGPRIASRLKFKGILKLREHIEAKLNECLDLSTQLSVHPHVSIVRAWQHQKSRLFRRGMDEKHLIELSEGSMVESNKMAVCCEDTENDR